MSEQNVFSRSKVLIRFVGIHPWTMSRLRSASEYKLESDIFLQIVPYIVVFVSSLFSPYDPDLGWHLKYGEYFVKNHQILRENIFSSEMVDYHWVNSSWITDIISYLTFSNFGFLGLSILAAFVITLTFFVFSKASKVDFFEKSLIFPILLYLMHPLNSVSFKGQLFSLLFSGVLVYLFHNFEEKKSKLIFLSIPLFILWSNLHGQFILGLGIFAVLIFLYFVKLFVTRAQISEIVENGKYLMSAFLLSVLGVLVHPFGFSVYSEAMRHFGNPWQKYIYEWLPTEELSVDWWKQLGAGLMIFLGLIYVIFSGQFKNKITTLAVLPFYLLSFLVRRYLWTSYYLGVALMQPMANFFKPETQKWANRLGGTILIIYMLLVINFFNPFERTRNMSWEKYCQQYIRCSADGSKFLLENRSKYSGELLTFYDWGGFLIWNYPGLKPSIDGRMHLWRDDEGYSAFASYYPLEQNTSDIEDSKYDVVFMSPLKPMYDRLEQLVLQNKWRLVYEDDYSGIFVRN